MKRIENIFEILKKENPSPKTDLTYTNEFTLAVAVILSAQSTDKGVNKATDSLFKTVKTPQDILNLGYKDLEPYLKTIGLYRNKTKNVLAMSKSLIENFNGKLPHDRKSLVSLAGIGEKTASVVRNVLWGKGDIAVDTHVFRLAHRLNFVPETANTAGKVAKLLPEIIPEKFHSHAGHWMVLHGRYICTARNPKCEKCNISEFCSFKKPK